MFWKSKGFKYLLNLFFGIGAAIVMVGAMSKLAHIDIPPFSGSTWIILGLGTEALLFLIQGLIPPHSEYYWEKVYPGIDQATGAVESAVVGAPGVPMQMGTGITAQLDEVLENANVSQLSIERLGKNLEKLSDNIAKMNDVADIGAANTRFVNQAESATNALGEVENQMNHLQQSVSALSRKYDDMLSAMKN